jgi:hypothetical protein
MNEKNNVILLKIETDIYFSMWSYQSNVLHVKIADGSNEKMGRIV